MEDLAVIPQVTLKDDGWEYRITAFSDVLDVEYWDDDPEGGKVKRSSFNIPSYCAVQVLEEMLKLAKERAKIEERENT